MQRYACEIVRALGTLLAPNHPLAGTPEIELLTPKHPTLEFSLDHIKSRIVAGLDGHLWEQLVLPQSVSGGLTRTTRSSLLMGKPAFTVQGDIAIIELR